MLTEKELNELADYFADIYAKASEEIMTEIGKNIKRTGDLTPSQAKAIQQMHKSGADMRKLDAILKRTSGKGLSDMQALYEHAVSDSYGWAEQFYKAKGLTSIPLKDNPALKTMLNAIARSSGKELTNLSRTTAIGIDTAKGFTPLDKFYKDAVNKAILSASTGAESYQKAVQKAVKELGGSGLRIQYESGKTRRLDSAVRQNILDGMSYIAQETAKYHGEQFGADGYEISAHSPCAPDHLPHQGLQYTKDEFEDLQSGLDRQIGEWNCRHIAYPIIVGVSGAANSREELAEMERYSNEKIEIDGHEYTRYECSQIQRRLETEMRKANEQRILGKNSGIKDLERQARERLNLLTNKYAEVSRKSELPVKAERMRAVEKSLTEKVAKSRERGIINNRGLAMGMRQPPSRILTEKEIASLKVDAKALGIDEKILVFNTGRRTGFDDDTLTIGVCGDVLPDTDSKIARDCMSQRAVLAHEYYGHYAQHPSKFPVGDWRDEFGASYKAALNAPNLSDRDRALLMVDAYDRAREAGVIVKYNDKARRIVYGY